MTLQKTTPDDSLSRAKSLDLICDQFEKSIRSGTNPRIEEYLDQVATDERMQLLLELVTLEVQCTRTKADIDSLKATYLQRFPELPFAFLVHLVVNSEESDVRPPAATDAKCDTAIWRTDTDLETSRITIRDEAQSLLPAFLGRYKIISKIGQGGMGEVYLGRDPQLKRLVAIKVPRHDGTVEAKREFAKRFCREAQAAGAVRHPHVCPIYDVGDEDGVPYVVMAYVEGETLAERIRRLGRYESEDSAIELAINVADALQAVHSEGIVHRDLKPGNILLDPHGTPFVTDFGLACYENREEHLTVLGTPLGTPAYMAPEQVSSGIERAGPAADIYGLGVILYEVLTGQLPYDGDSLRIMAMKVASKPPKQLRELRPEIDPALVAIVSKAMNCDPQLRFATAADFAAAMSQLLAKKTASTGSLVPDWRTRLASMVNFYPRNARQWGIAISMVCLMVIGFFSVLALYSGSSLRHEIYTPDAPVLAGTSREGTFKEKVNTDRPSKVIDEKSDPSSFLDGSLVVTVSRNSDAGLVSQNPKLLTETDALPIRPGDQLHIEARLNRSGYAYVLWIDSEGEVSPLFPWDFGHSKLLWDAPLVLNASTPRTTVHIPELLDEGLDVGGPSGTQSIVLLASHKPLPSPQKLRELVGTFEPRPQSVTSIAQVSSRTRGPKPGSAQKMTDPVAIQLDERLREHFDLIHVVSFTQVD